MYCISNLLASAGGRNPRYHGNGIWTSQPQDYSDVLGLLMIIGVVIIVWVIRNRKMFRK